MSANVRVRAGSSSSSSSVSIPANARKVVQDLKEIVSNSEEEIYTMLKECNMDPNETVQKLLNQGMLMDLLICHSLSLCQILELFNAFEFFRVVFVLKV